MANMMAADHDVAVYFDIKAVEVALKDTDLSYSPAARHAWRRPSARRSTRSSLSWARFRVCRSRAALTGFSR
jgi:hypothetical protein